MKRVAFILGEPVIAALPAGGVFVVILWQPLWVWITAAIVMLAGFIGIIAWAKSKPQRARLLALLCPLSYTFYDGDQEIAEYEGSNTILTRRFIRLPGSVDEPFLIIDYTLPGTCTTAANGAAPCERWAHQNRQGSAPFMCKNGA